MFIIDFILRWLFIVVVCLIFFFKLCFFVKFDVCDVFYIYKDKNYKMNFLCKGIIWVVDEI